MGKRAMRLAQLYFYDKLYENFHLWITCSLGRHKSGEPCPTYPSSVTTLLIGQFTSLVFIVKDGKMLKRGIFVHLGKTTPLLNDVARAL